MYQLLYILAVIGHVASLPLNEATGKELVRNDRAERYELPGESLPTFYDVRLLLDPNNDDGFSGNVTIRVIPLINTNQIILHAMELTINSISVVNVISSVELFSNFTLAQDDTHFLVIETSQVLNALEPYEVHISYDGKYAANMFGVYLSTYQQDGSPQRLITSQLQPTFARRAFPCYDEPAMKAVFRTTIYAPATYPVVKSNMPAKTNNFIQAEIPGFTKFEFEDTVMMSTYLLAYLVSNLNSIDNSVDQTYRLPFSIYSRPGTQDNAEFAMEFGQDNMVALEAYTEMAYAFPKLDNAAVPDFAAGAMENWGLIVYREVALLYQKGVTTTATKQGIGRIISHENTHQWFGNEVSPHSWTYTWLNEGFANFFESFATHLVRPEWRTMDQFVLQVHGVFQNDAVLSVNPMTHPVYTPSEILGQFNAVAYQKSGSVIRMMQHFLTPEVFRRGLVIYLQNRSRRAALPSDLYSALQQALDQSNHTIPYSLVNVMTRWTEQGGFPVLNVWKSAPTANSLSISQQRFLTDNSLTSNDVWHVPLNWVLSSSPNFEDTKTQGWLPASRSAAAFDIQGLAESEWYIVNKQQTGYYRVNYDLENWAALAKALQADHKNIHVLNRAQLLDDAFNLARNGRLSYVYAFELSRYLSQEADYIPWSSVNTAFNYLDIMLSGADVYEFFKLYLLDLSKSVYEDLGFAVAVDEEHVTPYHRNIVLDINCRYGLDDCVSTAQKLLEEFKDDQSKSLDPDIQTTVYCAGLRGGSSANFNFLWKLYEDSTDSSEQSILLNALGCISDVDLRNRFMRQVIDENSIVREQDRHTVLVATINSSPENMDAALDFVIEHFAEIQPKVQGFTGTTNILDAFARRLTTQAQLLKIEEFEERYNSILTAGERASIAAIKENIAASLTWSNQNLAVIDSWLRSHYDTGNSANVLSCSFVLIVSVTSVFLAYF